MIWQIGCENVFLCVGSQTLQVAACYMLHLCLCMYVLLHAATGCYTLHVVTARAWKDETRNSTEMLLRIQIGILKIFHWSLFERLIWKETWAGCAFIVHRNMHSWCKERCTLSIHDSHDYSDDLFGCRLGGNGLHHGLYHGLYHGLKL